MVTHKNRKLHVTKAVYQLKGKKTRKQRNVPWTSISVSIACKKY